MTAPNLDHFLTPYYVPPALKGRITAWEERAFGPNAVTLRMPVVTPQLAAEIMAHVTASRETYLAAMPVAEIAEAIGRAAELWRNPQSPWRQVAASVLPTLTGYDKAAIEYGLNHCFQVLTGARLLDLAREELGDAEYLDGFRPRRHAGGRARAFGPRVIVHVNAGNIPGPNVHGLAIGLLTKAAVVVKSATDEPVLAAWFTGCLAQIEPRLTDCLAALWWPGGNAAVEDEVFTRAGAVIASGSDASLAAIRAKLAPDTIFLGYGHKIGLGIVGRGALMSQETVTGTAGALAMDVSLFDQQGCVSPHVVYVEEGGQASPRQFAATLAATMDALSRRMPPGPLDPSEATAIHNTRARFEFREIAGEPVATFASQGSTDWTVLYDEDPTFEPSCLNRLLYVKPVPDVAAVPALLAPYRRYLQTVAVAGLAQRLEHVATALGLAGVSRICPIGSAQRPPLTWHHDGALALAPLLRWVDVD